jgi:hypothetical protein
LGRDNNSLKRYCILSSFQNVLVIKTVVFGALLHFTDCENTKEEVDSSLGLLKIFLVKITKDLFIVATTV